MAAISTSPRPHHNPATLKFTAVKVDVSALTKLCRCKAFVINSQTTSRDLTDMVLQKLKIDVTDHVNGTCLLGQPTEGGEKRILSNDERVLNFMGSKSKRTLTLELVPYDSVRDTANSSATDADAIKAGNLSSESSRNGMTLPGYQKTDVNYNVTSSFVTSTPNPDNNDSVRSTTDSGFLIHYEPYRDNVDSATPHRHLPRQRSKSFELARDLGYQHDISTGNASDSGMVANGSPPKEEVQSVYPLHSSPKDGFQILQSKNSAWTPFSRHMSEGYIKSLSPKAVNVVGSVPNVSDKPTGTTSLTRKRSLPKMTLSQEQLEEKKKSVTDLFASKLKLYIESARSRKYDWSTARRYQRRSQNRDDDSMSVTSQEVAEILSSASPMKPYEESEEEEEQEDEENESTSGDSQNESANLSRTPQNVFQPLNEPPLSPEDENNKLNLDSRNKRHGEPDGKPSLGEFVEQSLKSFMISDNSSHDQRNSSSGSSSRHSGSSSPIKHSADRGVPLFTLLTTHLMAPVMVRRNLQMPNKAIGIRLCDVTYAKCVRHVIRHWATQARQFGVDPQLSERMMVAIGGIDRRTTVILAGKLFRGDIIVEVNGASTLQLSARDVIKRIGNKDVVSLVVARSRLNVERAQSP